MSSSISCAAEPVTGTSKEPGWDFNTTSGSVDLRRDTVREGRPVSPQHHIGRDLGSFIFDVERAQLRLFAKVTGERRPMNLDPQAARAAGYRELPAPPAFAFTIGMKPQDPVEM